MIKKCCIAFLALSIIALLIPSTAFTVGPSEDPERLEAFFDGVIKSQMIEHDIVGATMALVQDGEIVLLKGYGYSDLEQKTVVDPTKTLFRPGSSAKLITWSAVMQLVEQGKLDLDEDINQYIDFEIPAKYHGSLRSRQAGPITMSHLLTHTPGFEDQGADLFVLAAEKVISLEEYLKKNIPARVFPEGEVMAYSNYGAALAGYIVEKVSGLSFNEYVERNIFEPLGMENSSFRQPLPEELAMRMSEGYKFSNGQYYQGSFEYITALPAGSMSSTAKDMAMFMIAHLQDGQYNGVRILEKKTVQIMHDTQFSYHPELDGMTYGFIEQTINGKRIISHGGNTFLFGTGLYLLPEENVGLFISYNGGTGLEREFFFKAFMDQYYPASSTSELIPSPGSLERAAVYSGEYHPTRADFTTILKLVSLFQAAQVSYTNEGHLTLNFFGMSMHFVEEEEGVYRYRYPDRGNIINTLVFVPGPFDKVMLCTEGPLFNMIKAPWYGSGSFAGFILILNLLLLITAIGGWVYAAIGRFLRKEIKQTQKMPLAARACAFILGLLLFIFLFGLIGALMDIDPAIGVPRIMVEESSLLDSLLIIPYFIGVTILAMVCFTILAWVKKYWNKAARIHYSLLTLSSLGLAWIMIFLNLL